MPKSYRFVETQSVGIHVSDHNVYLHMKRHHTVFYLVNQYSKLILAEFCSFARFIVLHYTSNIQISYTNDCYPLQTLQTMLAAVKKGRPVDEAEIPPPVATGAPSAASRPAVPQRPAPPVPSPPESSPSDEKEKSVPEIVTPSSEEEQSSTSAHPTLSSVPSPEEPADQPQTDSPCELDNVKLHQLSYWLLEIECVQRII